VNKLATCSKSFVKSFLELSQLQRCSIGNPSSALDGIEATIKTMTIIMMGYGNYLTPQSTK